MSATPFYLQERPESCVPAYLRMTLATYGVDHTEDDLYRCCQTDIDSTLPSAAADCARQLGFDATATRLPDLESLQGYLETPSAQAIAFVNLTPLLGVNIIHAVVIETIDIGVDRIQVIDPVYPPNGRRVWALGLFVIGWQMARRQVILIAAGHG